MKKRKIMVAGIAALGMFFPMIVHAQSVSDDMQSMHTVLEKVYNDMIPQAQKLITVARGLAAFGALWYIASRVWKSIAHAEPVDVYPLLKPFVLATCILMYGNVMDVFNGVLKPITLATQQMVTDSDAAIKELLAEKEKAIQSTDSWKMYVGENGQGDQDRWYRYTHHNEDPPTVLTDTWGTITSSIKFEIAKQSYNFQNHVKAWLSEILNLLYQAASLCVDTIRTYYLVVLTILGPLVFGFSCFDGFSHSLTNWMGRYIHIYLWLPVANIFGAIIGQIQQNMIKIDLEQIKRYGDTVFGQSDTAYLVFLIIAIVGYTTVPSVANYIVQATGSHSNVSKITNLAALAIRTGSGNVAQSASALYNARRSYNEGHNDKEKGPKSFAGDVGRLGGYAGSFMHDKLKGKPKDSGENASS